MGSVEVRQLPLPFPLRICRLSQRDSEPQGQDRVEAGERVQRSAYRGKKSRHGKTYSPYALRVGGTVSISVWGDLRVSHLLTEAEAVDPTEVAYYYHEGEQESRDSTFMRLKEIWMYICAASIIMK